MYSGSASATFTGSSSSTATATGNNVDEANENAIKSANISAYYSVNPPTHTPLTQQFCTYCNLNCIDFRFIDDYGFYMNVKGNVNDYDQIVLAGASLGYNGIPGYENWTVFADENIELARLLHRITEINIFDHLDCGAYRLVYTPEQLAGDGAFKLHVENLNKAAATMLEKYPFLTKVNKYIVDLKYNVIPIP